MTNKKHIYDVIIIGGGPGGYTAALYSTRAGLDTLLLEKMAAGGQMALTAEIDNYPGFDEGIDGYSLGEKMRAGAERFGARTEMTEVQALELETEIKTVRTPEGEYYGRSVIFSTGAAPRELGIAGENELIGRGVHYCAACDGMFYRGKTVVVVGGGNTAAEDAVLLSRVCEKVILVHRRDKLRATKVYHEPLKKASNVEFVWNSTVTELLQEDGLTGIKVKNVQTDEETEIACDGVFVSIGRKPATELVKGQLELDEGGYVIADETTRTNLPGVFAAGDLRTKALRQIVTAASDGAVAAYYAEEYLNSLEAEMTAAESEK